MKFRNKITKQVIEPRSKAVIALIEKQTDKYEKVEAKTSTNSVDEILGDKNKKEIVK